MKIALCYVSNILSKLFCMCAGCELAMWYYELEPAVADWEICVTLLLAVLFESLSNLPGWKEQAINRRALAHAANILADIPDFCFFTPCPLEGKEANFEACAACTEKYLLQGAEKQLKEERRAKRPWNRKKKQ